MEKQRCTLIREKVKAKITARFLRQKISEYELIKSQIKKISEELKMNHELES